MVQLLSEEPENRFLAARWDLFLDHLRTLQGMERWGADLQTQAALIDDLESAARGRPGSTLLSESLLKELEDLSDALWNAGNRVESLKTARRAHGFLEDLLGTLQDEPQWWFLQRFRFPIGILFHKVGASSEALAAFKHAVALFEGWRCRHPEDPRPPVLLGHTWLGSCRNRRGELEAARAAWSSSLKMWRLVFDQQRTPETRWELHKAYDRLTWFLYRQGRFGEAAPLLLEQAELWPDDANRLLDVAGDLDCLALAVGRSRDVLTAEEQDERTRYLEACRRLQQEAVAAWQRTSNTGTR